MTLKQGKKQVTISMPISKLKEFKKLAIDHDMTLSQLLTTAGTITEVEDVKKYLDTGGAATIKTDNQ